MHRRTKNLLEAFTVEERIRYFRAAIAQAVESAKATDNEQRRQEALALAARWRDLLAQAESSKTER